LSARRRHTFDARWTKELIHEVHFQVWHLHALCVIPFVASVETIKLGESI
jgi:hypothetical protein